MKTKVFSVTGEEIKDIELNDGVFACDISEPSIYYAIKNELANLRVGTASTKTRGTVSGSTAKLYRQKGTGNARAGSAKSPVRVGGGTIFGPHPRDYHYQLPKKIKKSAYRSILSLKLKDDRLKIVEDFSIDTGKTKALLSVLKNLVPTDRTVIVLGRDDALLKQAGSNLPGVSFLAANRLRAHDLFYAKNLLVLESAAASLNQILAVESKRGNK